jgi:3-hydroxymyristoyl/3-hydroxydecanoyl-(acyl carrier protein) dehydratase
MKLIHRVLDFEPSGGRYGLGSIKAEADVHPNDWYLTCHFPDDMVMPGTLMYECCAHALRIFLLRFGWVTDREAVCFEPIIGVKSRLKCRGPVTPKTKRVLYEIQIKEMGCEETEPPFVLADALMYADGRRIVKFEDMSMQMTGVTGADISAFWKRRKNPPPASKKARTVLFDRKHILAFCEGNPSEAFGEPYREFDNRRRIARLPRPPYSFIDRVVEAAPEPWVVKPGGPVTAEYDIPPDAWYFAADRTGAMPFCVLMEIALQPCGFTSAYMGSALTSAHDLKYRNLGGSATLHRNVFPRTGTLTITVHMTKADAAGDMLIQHFSFRVSSREGTVYEGTTYFGFFTETALANQVGLRNIAPPQPGESGPGEQSAALPKTPPLHPDDPGDTLHPPLSMPAAALLMHDEIEAYDAGGGPRKLGFIRAGKQVNPDDWYFRAHFYQDPVIPGSLGVEGMLQTLRFAALNRWPALAHTHRFRLETGIPHRWEYRGQIIPRNRRVHTAAVITDLSEGNAPRIRGDGYVIADNLYIYKVTGFGYRLIPISRE